MFGARIPAAKVYCQQKVPMEARSAPRGRHAMNIVRSLLFAILLIAVPAFSQTKIVIPAGTPEDKALTDISQEAVNEKRISMLEEFVQKYASNPAAVAYGYWQLSQQFSGSDPNKALGYGDKALAAMPDVLDIIQSQIDLAQQTKNSARVVDYATRGAVVIQNIEKMPKPADTDEESWKANVQHEKEVAQPVYDYMATAAFNAIASEPDPKKRVTELERFSEVFRGSKLNDNANLLAVATFQELNDLPKLVSFGQKILAADPNNASMLTLMANAFAEDPKGADLAQADTYARKAIEIVKSDQKSPAESRLVAEGFAHEILGYSLLRQEKTSAAIVELKTATGMLKADSAKYSVALYRLGFAYAKSKQTAAAKQTLAEAMTVDGPFKQAAKELLDKVNTPAPAAHKK